MHDNAAVEIGAKTEPSNGVPAEYCRIDEVERRFGISRGTIYNLLRRGRIRGCSLHVKGKKSRIRLIDLESLRALVKAEINNQHKEGEV